MKLNFNGILMKQTGSEKKVYIIFGVYFSFPSLRNVNTLLVFFHVETRFFGCDL